MSIDITIDIINSIVQYYQFYLLDNYTLKAYYNRQVDTNADRETVKTERRQDNEDYHTKEKRRKSI